MIRPAALLGIAREVVDGGVKVVGRALQDFNFGLSVVAFAFDWRKRNANKKYYVRVRAYKAAKGMNYSSAWSAVKTVKANEKGSRMAGRENGERLTPS